MEITDPDSDSEDSYHKECDFGLMLDICDDFCQMVFQGHYDEATSILENYPFVREGDLYSHDSPLVLCSSRNDMKGVKFLLKSGYILSRYDPIKISSHTGDTFYIIVDYRKHYLFDTFQIGRDLARHLAEYSKYLRHLTKQITTLRYARYLRKTSLSILPIEIVEMIIKIILDTRLCSFHDLNNKQELQNLLYK